MTTETDPAQELRNTRGRLAALKLYASEHPNAAFVHPHIAPLEARARALTAELADPNHTTVRNTTVNVNIDIMRQTLSKVQGEMQDIHRAAGHRRLNAAQEERWAELETEAETLSTNIETAEKQAKTRANWSATGSTRDGGNDPAAALRMDDRQAKDTAFRMLDTQAHLDDRQREHVDHMLRAEATENTNPGALARHIVLTSGEDYRSAFRKVTARFPSSIVPVTEREANALAIVNRASMAEGAGGTGGFAVPAFLDPTIVLNAQGSANPIRRLARNETITTKTWKGVGTDGVTWEFVAEGQASSDASPTVSQPVVDVHTARAWITYSLELEQDAVELDAQLLRLLGNGWEETVAGVLATGSGSGAPKGVITALDAIAASEVQIAAPGALAAGDVSKAWIGLPDRARENAAWVMSESVRETVAGWGDAFGNRTVDLGGRLTKLRDRPVYSTDKFPAIATTTGSANQMVVGDFSGYLIVQRAGMTVEPVQTVFNGDGFPIGQRGLFAWARIGADVIDAGKLRLLQQ